VKIQNWLLNGLPNDKASIENALIIKKSSRWPIVVDPEGQGVQWIKR
jgi:dynein heavy chain